jgi:hypothetical protein
MRKLIREHDAGTERVLEMTARRIRLMQLIDKKDFKSFHNEVRPRPHQQEGMLSIANGESPAGMIAFDESPKSLTGKKLAAIAAASAASNLRSSQFQSSV